MQDAFGSGWTREPHLSPQLLDSLRELNHRFLDWLGTPPGDWALSGRGGLSIAMSGRVAPLSNAQRAGAANCPYALFDLRFRDEAHWASRLQHTGRWLIADEPQVDEETAGFVRLALFYAWHIAATAGTAAPLLLGMSEQTAAAFRRVTVNRLPALVATEASNLTARWSYCDAYWGALVSAALHPDGPALRRVQLYGLQLAAAERLS